MIIDIAAAIWGDNKRGPERNTTLDVTLRTGLKVRLGDTELMFL
jgi:hypothetical protein